MQTLFNVGYAHSNKFVDFAEESLQRHDGAVADEAFARCVHDARRDQTQDGLLAVDDKRMSGVVAAIEANDAGSFFRQPVNDLAFAFVAPLSADHDNILAHLGFLRLNKKGSSGPPVRPLPAGFRHSERERMRFPHRRRSG